MKRNLCVYCPPFIKPGFWSIIHIHLPFVSRLSCEGPRGRIVKAAGSTADWNGEHESWTDIFSISEKLKNVMEVLRQILRAVRAPLSLCIIRKRRIKLHTMVLRLCSLKLNPHYTSPPRHKYCSPILYVCCFAYFISHAHRHNSCFAREHPKRP